MNPSDVRFLGYTFTLSVSGDIIFEEITPEQLMINTGDKFEAVVVPTIGIVFKKL